VGGANVAPLPARAFDSLAYLIAHPGRPIDKNEIIAAAWRDVAVTDDSLIHAISMLRRGLGDEVSQPSIVETIPRFGYRFIGTVEPAADTAPLVRESTPEAGDAPFLLANLFCWYSKAGE
jgi:DNA-binding winged helix-turn-helix (wHTH) protein